MKGITLIQAPAGLHFVAWSDEGPLPPVDQMRLATRFDAMACGVAVAECMARSDGRTVILSDSTLAWDEGNTGHGASVEGVAAGLRAVGITSQQSGFIPNPLGVWVMNPDGGRMTPPGPSLISKAVRDWPNGCTLICKNEDDMSGAKIYQASDGPHYAAVDGNGTLFDVNMSTRQAHQIQTGLRPYGLCDASAPDGVPNIVAAGTLGDIILYSFDGGSWKRVPAPSPV